MKPPSRETFIIHIWWADAPTPQQQWRGQVQHVLSGETFSFQEPSALWRFIDHWREPAERSRKHCLPLIAKKQETVPKCL